MKTHTLAELAAMPITKRKYMLDPIVPVNGMSMMYAPAGTGKSLFALSLAHAISQGNDFLRWKCQTGPQPVLYVDGEMPEEMLLEYVQKLKPATPNMRFLATSLNHEAIPNLSEWDGQQAVEAVIEDARLVVFDNKSCLFRSGVENEAASWGVANDWLIRLRARGVSSLLIHHANKAGQQRGTNRIMDQMDLVARLQRPPGVPKTIAKFDITYDKIRAGQRLETEEFNVEYRDDNGIAQWSARDGTFDPRLGQALEMRADGKSNTQIAKELHMSKRKLLSLFAAAELYSEGKDPHDEAENEEFDRVDPE